MTVCLAATASAEPIMLTSTVFPSERKIVTLKTADFVLFEVLVIRALAPALPRSVLKLIDSKRNDLSVNAVDFLDFLGGVAVAGAATQRRLQVYIFEATVFLLPITSHFLPAVTAAYEFGIMDIKKAISVAVASKRFISSPYLTLLPFTTYLLHLFRVSVGEVLHV